MRQSWENLVCSIHNPLKLIPAYMLCSLAKHIKKQRPKQNKQVARYRFLAIVLTAYVAYDIQEV